MKNHNKLNVAAWVLLVIAGLCWGLVGLFDFDLIGTIFGDMSVLTRVIFVLFGLAAVYKLVMWFRARK